MDGIAAANGLRKGNFVATAMPLVYIVPKHMYIVANFKETQIVNFKEGQEVDISFDAISGHYNGKVKSISPASGSTFSLIPTDNATGNFTKIVQRVPIIIEFDNNQKGLEALGVGMSTSISIDTR
jgi:membrane fusion protein (multidrug efflux system)